MPDVQFDHLNEIPFIVEIIISILLSIMRYLLAI